jgi:hypothetical protein
MAGLLGKISTGKIDRAPRLIVHGEAGVGKSTFAAGFPGALLLDCEQRTGHLDVSRIDITSWEELIGALKELIVSDHEYETVVIDTLDHAEMLIHDSLCRAAGVKSIDDVGGGYGRGYTAALNEWRKFVHGVEALRKRNIGVVMLAHSHIKTFKNPVGEDYDKWQLKMNTKSANFLREISDAVGFAHFEDFTEEDNKKNHKAQTTGDRMLAFSHSPAYESKRGINLPDEVELSYEAFMEGRKENG